MKTIVDSAGRVQIPKDLRDKYNLNSGTKYKLIEEDDCIKLIPFTEIYTISNEDMKVLRKLYLLLSESGFVDEYYDEILSKITKKTESKCDKCDSLLFLNNDNTYKCFKCGD